MSRIVVIGGHGRTGILVVKRLVAAGHQVLATIRNPKHMADIVKLGAEAIVLDLVDSPFDDFVIAVTGCDAMVFAAGSAAGETSELDRKGTVRTLKIAKKAGIKRYVSISSIGASTGLSTRSMSDEMKDYYKQKRAAGKHIMASGLDWTILEPAELTDDPATGKATLSLAAIPNAPNTRDDVAAVTVALLAEPKSIGRAIQMAGGKTPIKTALQKALG